MAQSGKPPARCAVLSLSGKAVKDVRAKAGEHCALGSPIHAERFIPVVSEAPTMAFTGMRPGCGPAVGGIPA